jgi:hypothetical protein
MNTTLSTCVEVSEIFEKFPVEFVFKLSCELSLLSLNVNVNRKQITENSAFVIAVKHPIITPVESFVIDLTT